MFSVFFKWNPFHEESNYCDVSYHTMILLMFIKGQGRQLNQMESETPNCGTKVDHNICCSRPNQL